MRKTEDNRKLEDRMVLLRQVDIFKGVPDDILENIAEVLREYHVNKEEIIIRRGEEGHSMYIIADGSVRVHAGDFVLTRMGPGRVFGEYALFDSERRSASITAEEETQLLELDRSEFSELMAANVNIMQGVVKLVVKRIREMNEMERKLAQSYLKIQKQNEEIARQSENIQEQSRELEKKNDMLNKLNDEKYHLINVLAHDLRNPLTSSICLADLLNTHTEGLSKDQCRSLEVILNSLKRLNLIISQVLDINDIATKNIGIKPEITNLELLLRETTALYASAMAQKNITLKMDTRELYSNLDRNYASLIFENLLSNAIKFSPPNKTITVKLSGTEESVHIEIKDQGPGISSEDIRKLFGKYQKQTDQQAVKGDNSGVGLSIVKKYVDAMKGKVRCISEPGKGATIMVEFARHKGVQTNG
jgi:signal transduction histidine kinase